MIHTLEISYGLSLKYANICVYRLNELTNDFKDKGYFLTNFLDVNKKSKPLIFTVPDLPGINSIRLSKHIEGSGYATFRICFNIEAEILRTGTDTLDLYFSSSAHAKELQTQYAKAIFKLFPEAFNKRPALSLYYSDFAPRESYTEDEKEHSGWYALPYLPLASVRRLDLTFDLESEDEDHARLLTEMVTKSYYDGHKKIEKAGVSKNPEKHPCHDKIQRSKSRGFSSYYKHDRMFDEAYADRANIKQMQKDSKTVSRIEMSYTSNNRGNVKSLTWLDVPGDEMTLGPLPYLASEQVSFNAFDTEYNGRIGYNEHDCKNLRWFKLHDLYKEVNQRVKDGIFKAKEGAQIKKLARIIDKEGSLKPVKNLINGKKTRQRPCSPATYRKYRKLAMNNGIMLVPIPKESKFSTLSAVPMLRNFDLDGLGVQITTHMLPYQSISEYDAPELEPVKELYDDVLSFLYGLYDEYASQWNRKMEKSFILVTEENRELYGL